VSPPDQNFQIFGDMLDFESLSRFKDTGGEGVGVEVSDTSWGDLYHAPILIYKFFSVKWWENCCLILP
jgi:hypothetical protein